VDFWKILAIVGVFGLLGGLVNCLLSGEFRVPHSDDTQKVWRPGWIANLLVGGVAAIVVWGVYGPIAGFDLMKDNLTECRLPVAQLAGSILVGISGSKILTTMAEKEAERSAKIDFSNILKELLEKKGKP
jgi:hypothetical protein